MQCQIWSSDGEEITRNDIHAVLTQGPMTNKVWVNYYLLKMVKKKQKEEE